MSGFKKLYDIVKNMDPLILKDLLAEQPNLLRTCELELEGEDEPLSFEGKVVIKQSSCFEDLPWDAYVDGTWGDGFTPMQALRRALKAKKAKKA